MGLHEEPRRGNSSGVARGDLGYTPEFVHELGGDSDTRRVERHDHMRERAALAHAGQTEHQQYSGSFFDKHEMDAATAAAAFARQRAESAPSMNISSGEKAHLAGRAGLERDARQSAFHDNVAPRDADASVETGERARKREGARLEREALISRAREERNKCDVGARAQFTEARSGR